MRIPNFALTVSMFATLVASPVNSKAARGEILDLNSLSQFEYIGQDNLQRRASCHLTADPIARDFAGRLYQDFRLWTDGAGAPFSIRVRSPQTQRAPDFVLDGARLQFNIPLEGFLLEFIADRSNPTQALEFRLVDRSGVTGSPGPRIQCQNVRALRR